MDRLREVLKECVRTTQWRNSNRCISPADFKRLDPGLRGDGQSQVKFSLYRPSLSQMSLNQLAAELRSLLKRFVSSETDQIGNGLLTLIGGHNTMQKPTIPEFAKTLLKPATVLGPDRVTQLLAGWAADEPLRFHQCALLDGARIERDLEFPGGARQKGSVQLFMIIG